MGGAAALISKSIKNQKL
ncbi:hypothetical protein JTS96_14360 [Clostridium botulinum]|nr:hypothetical protein [Clostridium botulinum]